MTSRVLFERAAGNIGPDLFVSMQDTDLTGVTSISAVIRYENGKKLEKAAIITDPTAGKFNIEWAAGDLIEGCHTLEFVFVTGAEITTLPEGAPYVLRVRQRI